MLNGLRLTTPLEREWRRLTRREQALERAAVEAAAPKWREDLESRVPEKVLAGLQAAFSKGFSLVFQRGSPLLERACRTEELRQQHQDLDRAVLRYGRRRDLRKLKGASQRAQLGNLAVTTAEGIGLGALGIGMPDIVIFLGMLLKGVYETALHYGFPYDTPRERLLILKMMEAAVSRGPERKRCNADVDLLLASDRSPSPEELQRQLRQTGNAFAAEMLLVKFVQGLPLVGVLGGAANPLYYNRVMRYVQLKYQKRYLQGVAKHRGIYLR